MATTKNHTLPHKGASSLSRKQRATSSEQEQLIDVLTELHHLVEEHSHSSSAKAHDHKAEVATLPKGK